MRELSSVGRATALQAVGHRFEPCSSHHDKDSADEYLCGNGSVVERHLAKVNVAGSNLVSRSTNSTALFFYYLRATATGWFERAKPSLLK